MCLYKDCTAVFLLIILCLLAFNSKATTFSVTTTSDAGAGSFRQALTDANAAAGDDIIDFTVSGNITLSSALPQITDNLVINGHASGNRVQKIGGLSHRILDISNSAIVTINKLSLFGGTIVSGDGAGLLIQSDCSVTLNDCCIRNCYANATSRGGGIYVEGQATLLMTNCTVSDNHMQPAGGGGMTCAPDSDVTIVNCTFSHNSAGAILNYSFKFKMYNTILANSTPVGTPDFTNTGGAVSDNEQNIVELCQTGTDCSAFFSNADPGLGNLMTNDNGPTETRAIDSTSIAYNNADTASAPEYDQNGTPRDVNPDIGAYEVQVIDAIALIQNTSKEKCSAKDKGPFYLQVFDLNGRMITTEKYPGFLQTQNINSFLESSSKLNKSLYVIRVKNSQKVCELKMFNRY